MVCPTIPSESRCHRSLTRCWLSWNRSAIALSSVICVPITGRRGAVLQTERGPIIDFASNDYLGLASDPRLMGDASIGASRVGAGAAASRLIAGDTAEHEKLGPRGRANSSTRRRALSFSSGYSANVGIIPALVGRGDVIFSDELNHASLIDGGRA